MFDPYYIPMHNRGEGPPLENSSGIQNAGVQRERGGRKSVKGEARRLLRMSERNRSKEGDLNAMGAVTDANGVSKGAASHGPSPLKLTSSRTRGVSVSYALRLMLLREKEPMITHS
jgi:hypothetical protein